MSFWATLEATAGMSGGFRWVVLVVAGTLVLLGVLPRTRAHTRTALLVSICAGCGLLAATGLRMAGVADSNGVYRTLRFTSLYIEALAITNLAGVLIFDIALPSTRLRVPRITRELLLAVAYVVLAILLLSASGVNVAGIVATSAVLTVILGIALQDTLANIIGGLVLQTGHFIRVGDWVRINDLEGRVTELSWRQTAIETRNWDTIILPNNVITKGQVILLGHRMGAPRQHRQWIYFNVPFHYPPTAVIEAVEKAMLLSPVAGIATDPPPHCIVVDLKESYVRYALRYWLIDLMGSELIDSIARTRVHFALRRAAIPFALPAQSLFITNEDERNLERQAHEELERRLAALEAVDVFQALTADEREELAHQLSIAPYGRGETLIRQGTPGKRLYLLAGGMVEVRVAVDGVPGSARVNELHPGDYFGEMSLLTGEPRNATIVALTDVECYRLDKEALIDILHRRPQIAAEMSHLLVARRIRLNMIREGLNAEAGRQQLQHSEHDLLRRIRRFFALDSDEHAWEAH